ncbi:MAG TPA: hypothetical protein VMW58_03350 [Anaerolineae bacterium]|nr:hypothetical protein [Anaerolineae bacterium]
MTYIAYLSETNGDEIVTEDGYNAGSGTDQGYQSGFWLLAVVNFDTENDGDEVQIYVTGIGAETGKAGSLIFIWDGTSGFTNHGTVPFGSSSNPATPANLAATPTGTQGTIRLTWTDNTGGTATYRLYGSTQASGAGNGASNGHYYRITPFNYQCSAGACVGQDTTAVPGMNWYIVVADGSLSGHSNEASADGSQVTGVVLSSFAVTPRENEILIEWETASERDNLGFNLYRAESAEGTGSGAYVQLNKDLIPGTGNPIQGGSYSFVDQHVAVGVHYYYWLEDVEVGGLTTLHGPVSAVPQGYRLYLPVVVRD